MNLRRSIWILEDDSSCVFVYQQILDSSHQVSYFKDLGEFERVIYSDLPRPELIVADIHLPDGEFLNWLTHSPSAEKIRGIPLFVVSSMDDSEVLRAAFKLGVSDYFTKPFSQAELTVKVERLFDTPTTNDWSASENQKLQAAAPKFDPIRRTVELPGSAPVELTPKEFQILFLLRNSKNFTATRPDIFSRVWGDVRVDAKTLDVHLAHVRKKIAPIGIDVRFVESNSYRLIWPPNRG